MFNTAYFYINIKFIKNSTEQCSGFMAEGYSKDQANVLIKARKKRPGVHTKRLNKRKPRRKKYIGQGR